MESIAELYTTYKFEKIRLLSDVMGFYSLDRFHWAEIWSRLLLLLPANFFLADSV